MHAELHEQPGLRGAERYEPSPWPDKLEAGQRDKQAQLQAGLDQGICTTLAGITAAVVAALRKHI